MQGTLKLTNTMIEVLVYIKENKKLTEGEEAVKPVAIDKLVRAKIIKNISTDANEPMVFTFADDIFLLPKNGGLNVYKDGGLLVRKEKISKKTKDVFI
jgi:hypothetical protein